MSMQSAIHLSIRPMKVSDLSLVLSIQRQTFSVDLCEDLDVFENRFDRFGEYFRVAVLNEKMVGYLLCFPWKLGETPINNQKFPENLPEFDCFYLHDIAVLQEARGQKIAQQMISSGKKLGLELGFRYLSLVSVEQSGDYWDKLGFNILQDLSPLKIDQIQKIYGEKARLMKIDLI